MTNILPLAITLALQVGAFTSEWRSLQPAARWAFVVGVAPVVALLAQQLSGGA